MSEKKPIIKLTRAETLYYMLADAMFSLDPGETIGRARSRILSGAQDEELAELAGIVNEKRKLYHAQRAPD